MTQSAFTIIWACWLLLILALGGALVWAINPARPQLSPVRRLSLRQQRLRHGKRRWRESRAGN